MIADAQREAVDKVGEILRPDAPKSGGTREAMEIEPNADCMEATECTSFPFRLRNILEHNRGYLLDGLAVRVSQNVKGAFYFS